MALEEVAAATGARSLAHAADAPAACPVVDTTIAGRRDGSGRRGWP